jgi:hypothetical protein
MLNITAHGNIGRDPELKDLDQLPSLGQAG